jgi:hypothetical protein
MNIMQEHMKAERDLYDAAFVAKDTVAVHEANVRALSLIQRSTALRQRFDIHRISDHGDEAPELAGC